MRIQSLSVVVPNKACMNNCEFCVSKMHCENHANLMDPTQPLFDLHMADYIKRLEFARHNGCNTVMLTGCSEPQQNRTFLTFFGMFQKLMRDPFQWVEMQTTGALLDEDYLRFLRNHVGVNLVSLSMSSLDDNVNNAIIQPPANAQIAIDPLCRSIKAYGFGLRLSLNLTDFFDKYSLAPGRLFEDCRELGADQVTLRVLYSSGTNTPQDDWILRYAAKFEAVARLHDYVVGNGTLLGTLPYGAKKYSVNGMSVVIDADCMAKDNGKRAEPDENYKYLILQPDCRLYSQWDDPASMIF